MLPYCLNYLFDLNFRSPLCVNFQVIFHLYSLNMCLKVGYVSDMQPRSLFLYHFFIVLMSEYENSLIGLHPHFDSFEEKSQRREKFKPQ